MIDPVALAHVCADIYADAPTGFDHYWGFSDCHAAHRKIDDTDVIVFRGSKSVVDWMHDAEVAPIWDYRLGFVHSGFMAGLNDTLVAMSLVVGRKVALTGHSLGGARARLLAALLAYNGQPVSQCCVFGSPRPGFANVCRILQKSGTPLASYRNRNDPVPLVPFFGGLYQHTDDWIELDAPGEPGDLDPLRDHKIGLYIEGLKKIQVSETPA